MTVNNAVSLSFGEGNLSPGVLTRLTPDLGQVSPSSVTTRSKFVTTPCHQVATTKNIGVTTLLPVSELVGSVLDLCFDYAQHTGNRGLSRSESTVLIHHRKDD